MVADAEQREAGVEPERHHAALIAKHEPEAFVDGRAEVRQAGEERYAGHDAVFAEKPPFSLWMAFSLPGHRVNASEAACELGGE